jgi:hypothetical protein
MFQGGNDDESHLALPIALKKQARGGTIAQPSRTDAISSAAKVIHRHITFRDRSKKKATVQIDQSAYDIDNFLSKRYNAATPTLARPFGFTIFKQTLKKNLVPELPDEKKIFELCKRLVDRCHLNAESVIIALIYLERLMEMTGTTLTGRNWIPLLVVALLTASKVWDDHSTFNGDLCAIITVFTLQDINQLERRFLTDLSYSLHIPFSDYAKYYFGLRALRGKQARNVPKFYLKIGLGNARRVEEKTLAMEGHQRGMPLSL